VADFDGLSRAFTSDWPRGHADLSLTVLRAGKTMPLPVYTPRTFGLHPTQVYEAVSMFILFLLLNAFYPFRKHYGEVFALFLICYAPHRFINEQLRNDTDPVAFGMTLSQNGSILCLIAGLVMFAWLRCRSGEKVVEPTPRAEPAPAAT
jgi:prolipoprotein diacylglyceryltransferase